MKIRPKQTDDAVLEESVMLVVNAALTAIADIPGKLPPDADPTVKRLVAALALAARNDFLYQMRASALTMLALEKAMKK